MRDTPYIYPSASMISKPAVSPTSVSFIALRLSQVLAEVSPIKAFESALSH